MSDGAPSTTQATAGLLAEDRPGSRRRYRRRWSPRGLRAAPGEPEQPAAVVTTASSGENPSTRCYSSPGSASVLDQVGQAAAAQRAHALGWRPAHSRRHPRKLLVGGKVPLGDQDPGRRGAGPPPIPGQLELARLRGKRWGELTVAGTRWQRLGVGAVRQASSQWVWAWSTTQPPRPAGDGWPAAAGWAQ
jgi:hypothetical protein